MSSDSVTTVCISVDRSLQNPVPICCFVFRGIEAGHPSMTLDTGTVPLGHNSHSNLLTTRKTPRYHAEGVSPTLQTKNQMRKPNAQPV